MYAAVDDPDVCMLLLTFLEFCIPLWPFTSQVIVAAVPRITLQDTEIAGRHVPKGSYLNLCISHVFDTDARWAMHDSSQPLANANFNPDRCGF